MKKVLFIIASVLIGFLLVMNAIYFNFYSVFQKFTTEAANSKNYTDAEKYYSRVFDADKFYVNDFEDGTHVEVFSSINDNIRYTFDEEGKETKTSYYTIENSIEFVFFNLPKDFSLQDSTSEENPTRGGVTLSFDTTESTFIFPFKSDTVDFYSYQSYYSYLPMNIFYKDYASALQSMGIPLTSKITKASISDGTGEVKYVLEFTKDTNFETEFFTCYNDLLTEYNTYQADTENKIEDKSKLLANVQKTLSEKFNDGTYEAQHNVNIIYKSQRFIWSIVIVCVIFLIVDGGLGYLVFRKKKGTPTKYIPKSSLNKGNSKVVRQPEQFSRDVFEEENVVDATVEEPKVEEAKEETETSTETEEVETTVLDTPAEETKNEE